VTDSHLCSKLAPAAGQLYTCLEVALKDPAQQQLVDMTLSVSPSIWVGSGFAFPAVCSFKGPDSQLKHSQGAGVQEAAGVQAHDGRATAGSLQQLLWQVPEQLLQQHPAAVDTLKLIGVAQQPDFAAYAIATAVVAEQAAGKQLSGSELDVAIQLADCAALALLGGLGSMRQLQQPSVIAAATALQAAAAAAAGSSTVMATGGPELLLVPDSAGSVS